MPVPGIAGVAMPTRWEVNLPASLAVSVSGAAPVFVLIVIKRNGTWELYENFSLVSSGYWVTGPGGAAPYATIGDLYNVKYDYSGDPPDSGPADDTYVQISSDQQWSLGLGAPGSVANTGTITIQRRRDSATTTPGGDSCSASMTVNAF